MDIGSFDKALGNEVRPSATEVELLAIWGINHSGLMEASGRLCEELRSSNKELERGLDRVIERPNGKRRQSWDRNPYGGGSEGSFGIDGSA